MLVKVARHATDRDWVSLDELNIRPAGTVGTRAGDGIEEVLAAGAVHTLFQPIVDLDAGTVVGFEALSRGPAGNLHTPDRLFAAARSAGRLAELDRLCRETAVASAVRAGLVEPLPVFVNIEPEVVDAASLAGLIPLAEGTAGRLRVVLEVTERAIAARPAELLDTVRRLREAGWQIALDDVGAEDMSLTFMPLLRPDIVKLDLRLVQRRPGPDVVQIMHAVNGYAERTGALILAEGIEHEQHLAVARALGARLGQGWMFGRPQLGIEVPLPTGAPVLPAPRPDTEHRSPFDCLPPGVALRRSSKPLLIEFSKFLEREAMRLGSTAMVLSAFQHADFFTPATAHRYRELARHTGFVAAVGEQLPAEPVAGVRGAHLDQADPVRGEWDVVVLAPHFAAALLARDLGDDGPDAGRTFEFALTYDRDAVVAAARSLMSRMLRSRQPDLPVSPSLPEAVLPPAHPGIDAAGEATLRRALAASTNGVTIADVTRPDAPLIYVNTAFERLSGLRAEEVLGRNCRILQGPDTDPAATGRIREAVAAGSEIRETLLNYRGAEREPWWNEIYLSPVFDADGRLTQYIGVQNDVTEQVAARRELEAERARSSAYLAELEAAAYRDPLTGLLNRRRLQDLLETAILEANLAGNALALLYLDVDRFKAVNDRHGHRTGDQVLQAVADRLRGRLRGNDLLARLGGDEFLVVLPDLDRASSERVLDRLTAELGGALDVPVPIEAGSVRAEVSVSVSIGGSRYPEDGLDFESLLHRADQRMYRRKRANA